MFGNPSLVGDDRPNFEKSFPRAIPDSNAIVLKKSVRRRKRRMDKGAQ